MGVNFRKLAEYLFFGMSLAACGGGPVQPEVTQPPKACQTDHDCPENQSCIEQRCSSVDVAQFRVFGTVNNWVTETPLEGVVVKLGRLSDTTDATGSYSLPTVSEGNYNLEFEKPYFKSRKEEISVFGADKSFAVEMLPVEQFSSVHSSDIDIVRSRVGGSYNIDENLMETYMTIYTTRRYTCEDDQLPGTGMIDWQNTDGSPSGVNHSGYSILFDVNFGSSGLNVQRVRSLLGGRDVVNHDFMGDSDNCTRGSGDFTSSKYVVDYSAKRSTGYADNYAVKGEGYINITGVDCTCYNSSESFPYDYSLSFEFELYQYRGNDPFK